MTTRICLPTKIKQSSVMLAFLLFVLMFIFDLAYVLVAALGDTLGTSNGIVLFNLVQFDTIILVTLIFIQIIIALIIVVRWHNDYWIYEKNKLTHFYGFTGKREIEYLLKNVISITYEQSIFGRIFDYGDVMINDYFTKKVIIISGASSPVDLVRQLEIDIKRLPEEEEKK